MTRLEDRIWFIVNEKEDDVCLITDNTNKCLEKFNIAPGVLDAMTHGEMYRFGDYRVVCKDINKIHELWRDR